MLYARLGRWLIFVGLAACAVAAMPATAAASGSISGTVIDNNSQAASGVCVVVSQTDPGTDGGSVKTDTNGGYSVTGLSAGTYRVQFTSSTCTPQPNYIGQWYNQKPDFNSADLVTVTDGQDTAGINAQLQIGGRIKGHVTGNHGENLAGICVTGGTSRTSYSTTTTDSNGNYTLQPLETGSYQVGFDNCGYDSGEATGGNWLPGSYGSQVSVTAGQDRTGIDVQLQPGGTIQGHITDEQGMSRSDLGIQTYDQFGNPKQFAVPKADGSYAVVGLATGTYNLAFFGDQWLTSDVNGVSVTVGQDTTGVNVVMHCGAGPCYPPSQSNPPSESSTSTTTGTSSGGVTSTTTGATAVASAITMSATAFSAESSGPSATSAKKKGTTVSFKLNRAATMVFTVQRPADGRKVKHGKKTTCDSPSKKNRKKKKCTRFVTLKGSFSRNGVAGTNKFHFTGRLNGKKLAPGKYRLVGTPKVGTKTGAATMIAFRIVP